MWLNDRLRQGVCVLLAVLLLTGCADGQAPLRPEDMLPENTPAVSIPERREALEAVDTAELLDGYDFLSVWVRQQFSYDIMSDWGTEHKYQTIWSVSQNNMNWEQAGTTLLEEDSYARALLGNLLTAMLLPDNRIPPISLEACAGGQAALLDMAAQLLEMDKSESDARTAFVSLLKHPDGPEFAARLVRSCGGIYGLLTSLQTLSDKEAWQTETAHAAETYLEAIRQSLPQLSMQTETDLDASIADLCSGDFLLDHLELTADIQVYAGTDTLIGLRYLMAGALSSLRKAQSDFMEDDSATDAFLQAFALSRALKAAEYRVLEQLCGADSDKTAFLFAEREKLAAMTDMRVVSAGIYRKEDSNSNTNPFQLTPIAGE